MVLAVAALLLQIGPAVQPLPNATLAPVVAAAPAPASPAQPDPAVATESPVPSSTPVPASVTATLLETSVADSRPLASIRLPDPPAAKPVRVIGVENLPSRRNWVILTIAQHGAATFDAYTTRQAVSRGGVERNPFMHPFAGSSAMYVTIQVVPVGLDFAARRMQRSHNNFLRRTWWLPQSVSTGLFIFSGVHNLHVANRP